MTIIGYIIARCLPDHSGSMLMTESGFSDTSVYKAYIYGGLSEVFMDLQPLLKESEEEGPNGYNYHIHPIYMGSDLP